MTSGYLNVAYATKKSSTTYDFKLAKRLLQLTQLENCSGLKILDLGCGIGALAEPFNSLGLVYTGVDYDYQSIEKNIYQGDIMGDKFPVGQSSQDIVISKMVIEHLNPLQVIQLFKKAKNSLKKGGIFIVITPDWDNNWRNFYDEFTHVTPFTKKSIETALLIAGFEIKSISNLIQLPWAWNVPFYSLIVKPISFAYKIPSLRSIKTIKYSKERPILAIALNN